MRAIGVARLAVLLLTAGGLWLPEAATGATRPGPEPSAISTTVPGRLSAADRAAAPKLRAALQEARARRPAGANAYRDQLADPVARKLIDWAVVDVMGDDQSVEQLERAIRQLDGWPRAAARSKALGAAKLRAGGAVPDSERAKASGGGAADFRARRLRMIASLRRGDAASAYRAMADHAHAPGTLAYAEAESFAGWLALNKLRNPELADRHFARLEAAVKTPVSKARAAYWRGRSAEARGQAADARRFYEQGATYSTTFYGQLAAQRAGRREIALEEDPRPGPDDRLRFERAEMTRVIRLLAAADEDRLVRVFGVHYGDLVETTTELALLVDELQAQGQQEASLLAYRRAARRGLILHQRGYPLASPPSVSGGAEPALVLAVARQESQFDPRVRSRADARGMMQILPATGRALARDLGLRWSDALLWDPVVNMRLGSRYLGQLTSRFGNSYLLATAGYNAGPRRLPDWISFCGDPRADRNDPLDFIECVPVGETRNYIMNVMANLQVYRARLDGGRAPLTAEENLRRNVRSVAMSN